MNRSLRFFLASAAVILANTTLIGQGVIQRITHPDAIGGNFIATHLDGLAESTSAGPGVELFLKYSVSPKFSISAGAGVSSIYDEMLTSQNFKQVLLPDVNLRGAINLITGKKFTPFIFGGLCAFGWTWTDGNSPTTDRYYDGGVFGGGGFEYAFNNQWSFQLSGDYRYIFTATIDPKPKYWVAKAGLTRALNPVESSKKEEIEYPLGENEIALDDLFKEVDGDVSQKDALDGLFKSDTKDKKSEDDALALLFQPEEKSEAKDTETAPSYSTDTEVGQLMARIQEMKSEMAQRLRQIDDLEGKVQANEKAIAEISGRVAGQYAGYSQGSFGVLNTEDFKANYEMALQRFYEKQYTEAIRIFSGLMASNPDNRLASNCQYWIGESHNALGEYRKAIDAFSSVMRYRSSFKFDDALLMSGLCHLKIGDRVTARENFQELVSRFPDSEYAPKAMRYLGRL